MTDEIFRALGRLEGALASFREEQRDVNASAATARKAVYEKLDAVGAVASATKRDVDALVDRVIDVEKKAKDFSAMRERLIGAGMLASAVKVTIGGTLAAGAVWVWQHIRL